MVHERAQAILAILVVIIVKVVPAHLVYHESHHEFRSVYLAEYADCGEKAQHYCQFTFHCI